MISEILILLICGLDLVSSQTTSATCSDSYKWMTNTIGQSPCLVAAHLGHQCAPDSPFNVPAITTYEVYLPPDGPQANQCECNTVYFSLLAACASCQGSEAGTYQKWSAHCKVGAPRNTYPLTPPNATRIPGWAFVPLSNDLFDINAAQEYATGVAQDEGDSRPTLSTPAIVGLSIGATVAAFLVLIAIWMYIRTRRPRQQTLAVVSGSDHPTIRYDKIEGPPRQRNGFFSSRSKIVSYKPGLNFDLDRNRVGDLVELSSTKKSKSVRSSEVTSSGSPTSVENPFHSRETVEPPQPHASYSLSSFFTKAKEIKSRRSEPKFEKEEPLQRHMPVDDEQEQGVTFPSAPMRNERNQNRQSPPLLDI